MTRIALTAAAAALALTTTGCLNDVPPACLEALDLAADQDPRYSVDLTARSTGGADVWAVIHGPDLRIGITAVTNLRCAAHALDLELDS